MYFMDHSPEFMKRRVVIACEKNGCSGRFEHVSWLSDQSPRVDACCSECKRFISIKLNRIEEKRIIHYENL